MGLPLPVVAVIEDDVPTLKALGRVLQALGFEPALYSSYEHLLASPPPAVPVCLLLDAHVKGAPALSLKTRIEALDSSIPVIVMTALDDPRVQAEAQSMGCAGYFVKSADVDVLLRQIRALLPTMGDAAPDR
jgi:FixJ family two-component response regulator